MRSARKPWGHESRRCARCGRVGPRVLDPRGFGYVHSYCLTRDEKKERRGSVK
jgi:hypothetical protein